MPLLLPCLLRVPSRVSSHPSALSPQLPIAYSVTVTETTLLSSFKPRSIMFYLKLQFCQLQECWAFGQKTTEWDCCLYAEISRVLSTTCRILDIWHECSPLDMLLVLSRYVVMCDAVSSRGPSPRTRHSHTGASNYLIRLWSPPPGHSSTHLSTHPHIYFLRCNNSTLVGSRWQHPNRVCHGGEYLVSEAVNTSTATPASVGFTVYLGYYCS